MSIQKLGGFQPPPILPTDHDVDAPTPPAGSEAPAASDLAKTVAARSTAPQPAANTLASLPFPGPDIRFTSPALAGASRLAATLGGAGAVDWNAITELKTMMRRADCDPGAMLAILENLRPADLAATLAALARHGTPSDLQKMFERIAADPGAMQRMAPFLSALASDPKLCEGQPPNPLDQILATLVGKPGADAVVRAFMLATQNQGVLPKLSDASLTSLYRILEGSHSTLNLLFETQLRRESGRDPVVAGGIWGLGDPTADVLGLLARNERDPTLGEAMRLFPAWGLALMHEAIARGQLPALLASLRASGQDVAAILAGLCKLGSGAQDVLAAVVADYGDSADQFIRAMVRELGAGAADVFGKFSLEFLSDVKAILLASDDPMNSDVVAQVIDPAMRAATTRQLISRGALMPDPGRDLGR